MGGISRQNSSAAVSTEFDFLVGMNFQFVEKLEEQYICPSCRRVVLNPHQTGCGHIFCYQCITTFLECNSAPTCPIDNVLIKSNEKSLEDQKDRVSIIQIQLQQLTSAFNQDPSRSELGLLKRSVDSLKQQVSVIESLKDRLTSLEGQYTRHSGLLNIHVEQLSLNEERFRQLEAMSYNGKLIWKIQDYKKKKKEAVEGRVPSIFSQAFYTSRSGYRLCARAYLNGDGTGKRTHLSLYVVMMRGEFDSLLPWPFEQSVTLMILDQSGAKNDIVDVFRPDLNSNSFKRPVNEMNLAFGFPCFVTHTALEAPKNGIYVKDETLFVKVKVDLTGLEEL
ncbi:UNVERIFIED_CONTAM: hypothetical protein FKN15_034563 [Acipenser sinensis]